MLLKNGGLSKKKLLPLKKDAKKVLVVGGHADDIGFQCGGWTITWQGSSGATTNGTNPPKPQFPVTPHATLHDLNSRHSIAWAILQVIVVFLCLSIIQLLYL